MRGGAARAAFVFLFIAGRAGAHGPTFTAGLGDAGSWGVPYGWLGPNGAKVWEEYRKAADTCVPPYSNARVSDPSGPVIYDQVRQGDCDAGESTFHGPGIFLGPNVDARTPPGATFEVLPVAFPPSVQSPLFDFRCGFMAVRASGTSPATFVSNEGGDNGSMDPYFGSWGTDGLYFHMLLSPVGPNWSVPLTHTGGDFFDADLVAGASALGEVGRTNWSSQVITSVPFNDAGVIPLGTPTSQPLPIQCSVARADAGAVLTVAVGGDLTLSWVFDDGMTRHGLTLPANPDGVGYSAALDPSSLVPVIFLGGGYEGILQPMPDLTLQVEVSGEIPTLEGLSAAPASWVPTGVNVVARDANGLLVPGYSQTVRFESSDPAAVLPAPYTFTSADQGSHAFQVTFTTPGTQSLTVLDAETPSLATTQSVQVGARPPFKVGCDCDAGSWDPLTLAAGVWLASLRLGVRGWRRRPPTPPAPPRRSR